MMIECNTLFGKKKMIPKDKLYFRPSAYGIIEHQGKLLVVQTTTTKKFVFPGGGTEIHETLEQSALREIKEEAGINAEIIKFFSYYENFFYYDPLDNACHGLCFFFICKPLTFQLLEKSDPEDVDAEKPLWVDITSTQKKAFNTKQGDVFEDFKKTYIF